MISKSNDNSYHDNTSVFSEKDPHPNAIECHKLPDCFEELSLYPIKLYIGITISMSLVLSVCALFISLMQSVNGAQFLNIKSSLLLFGFAAGGCTASIDIFPLKTKYASL